MALSQYRKKRNFKESDEPKSTRVAKHQQHIFVVHKHAARQLHWDLRLEVEGVLKSWAVPKGPPRGPQKHRAVQVEDHPYAYRNFKGTIPEGNYGAGTVEIWDHGMYEYEGAVDAAESEKKMLTGLRKGEIKLFFYGKKLKGSYALVRFRGPKNWLFIKHRKT